MNLGGPSSESLTMRDINMDNEIANTLAARLEAVLKKIEEYNKPT